MSRYDQLRSRHEKQSGRLGIASGGGASSGSPGTGGIVVKVAPGVIILAALLLGILIWYRVNTGGDSDAGLAAAGGKYRQAVGLVVVDFHEDGESFTIPVATAWGVRPGVAATNAHVALQLTALAGHGGQPFIAVNGRPDLRLRVTAVRVHDKYSVSADPAALAQEDPDDAGLAFDVALLHHRGEFPVRFPVADAAELHRVSSGYRVAYLGFPMENLFRGNVNLSSPVATMQSGIITAVSDFQQRDAGVHGNQLLRHNLGVTGGASGSPLFNSDGQVVGIVNGMNMSARLIPAGDGEETLLRTPSAAMINFAQRVDLLDGVRGAGFDIRPEGSAPFLIDRR